MFRMSYLLLMVINNFDIFRTGLRPTKANPEPPVDSNAVLTLAVTRQRFQHIAGRYFKIIKLTGSLELPDLPQRNTLKVDKAPDTTTVRQLFGILTLER
ncbi:hypothetical protein IB75_02135 [Nitrosococcus oceani C-27]|uniref:Uncharacterized protein n=1 Tax=Nitrosococcus oceani C-27 TaxID=314279 RepID=A0A0E2Z585_9GAMM|nr:hypothetical protein IB75_02135 [Nitrosococcus oceani C-27]